MLRLLVVPAVFNLLNKSDYLYNLPIAATAITTTLAFIMLSMLIAMMIDTKILWNMFFTSNDGKYRRSLFIPVNWTTANIFLVTLPWVIVSNNLVADGSELTLSTATKFALILSFSSVSYLMFYFVFALRIFQKAKKSKDIWKQYVPLLYYVVVTLFAYRAHSKIVFTIASLFLGIYLINVFGFSYNTSNSQSAESVSDSTTTTGSDCDWENTSSTALYKHFDLPSGSTRRHFIRQFGYDMLVYVLPITILGCVFPALQNFITGLVCIAACGRDVYEFVIINIYLVSSAAEDPQKAAYRLATYNKGAEYPTGWFRIANSDEIPCGRVKYVKTCGRELAVFRGEDGQIRALDAYCIHLGANMAIGGKVVGNCLECPFHKWTFGGDGVCTSIPYSSGKVPTQAKARAYYIYEYFGQILVWFRIGEMECKEPLYYPPIPKGLDTGEMVHRGNLSLSVNMHLQEFAENSTDFAHFQPLHGTMTFPFSPIEFPLITINHRPDWIEGKGDESHMTRFLDGADINFLGKRVEGSGADAAITFVGPGSVVFFTFETPIGIIQLFQTHTPDGPLNLKTQFSWYASATMPRMLVWYIVGNWIAQWQNDIMVWENKKFSNNPLLVKGDGPMNKQRRWFRQFYVTDKSENNTIEQSTVSSDTAPVKNVKTLDW